MMELFGHKQQNSALILKIWVKKANESDAIF